MTQHTYLVSETSCIILSKAAVSSACFWLCKAIFSENFLGLEAILQLLLSV